jgi:lipoprotein NlpI
MRRNSSLSSLIFAMYAAIVLGGGPVSAATDDAAALGRQALEASRQGATSRALSLATRAIRAAPVRSQGWLLRAQLYAAQGDHAKSAADYGEVVTLEPKAADAWQRRGEEHFKCGRFAESVSDFDRFLSLAPERRPFHWQRGISLYYAGRYAEGKQQFEIHQTVNPNDVENAVWHFLCTARSDGLDSARKQLIPIENDARVPMAQVHQLFAGKSGPQEVLAAARAAPRETPSGEPMFYANLYLGIYFEAIGDDKQAREYILKAAERAKENGYMGDVARVHADMLRKRNPKRGKVTEGGR